MGQAALALHHAPAAAPTPWRPDPQEARDIQGLIVSAYFHLPHAAIVLLELDQASPGPHQWLQALLPQVTTGEGRRSSALNIAFAAHGLRRLGLPDQVLATFSPAFRDGMAARARLLGDVGEQAPQTWGWSGGGLSADCELAGVPAVGAALLCYAESKGALDRELGELLALLGDSPGVRLAVDPIRSETRLTPHTDPSTGVETMARREHFGFADGLSQPVLMHALSTDTPETTWGPHGISVGEVVLGRPNSYGEPAPGTLAPDSASALSQALPPALTPGMRNLGACGSYLVLRQLEQDVAGFWCSMAAAARDLEAKTGATITAETLAERVVGRTRDGDLLVPGGVLPRSSSDRHRHQAHRPPAPANNFGFHDADPYGLGCPIGAHVRRANPRDSLVPDGADKAAALRAVNRHRILRRGRPYGPAPADRTVPDGVSRGLVFACLNSDIERQFEFIQHTWIGNDTFGGLFHEADPLIGPAGRFTIPAEPLRRCAHLGRFVTMRGGGYFFLPSLPALRYLAGVA